MSGPLESAGSGAPYDKGLQAERTALAWSRTAFAVLVNALIWLRAGWVKGNAGLICFGAALLLLAAGFYLFGRRRGRDMLHGARPIVANGAAVRLLMCACVVMCIAAAVAVLAVAY